jgi:heme exporter protein B
VTALLALIARDLRLSLRQGADGPVVVMFFVLTVMLFPLGIGPEPTLLARIAAGVIWVAALLACLLSLDRLFQADYEDGSLDLLALSVLPLEAVVLAKAIGHWLVTGLPLILAAPVMAVMLGLGRDGFAPLVLGLAAGTPSLSLLGTLGAALTLGARRGGVLVSLLVLPLTIPVLIFGAGAVDSALGGLSPRPELLLLGGLLAAALPLVPLAGAAALRQAVA